jgi:hypothetical protein
MEGKKNIVIGFLTLGFFMIYGFLLIYLRDFAPNKLEWINSYSIGKHFESRLAHVHGNLFAVLNIIIGFLLIQFSNRLSQSNKISWLALGGLLMPLGILSEVYFGLPPILVLIGAISMTSSVIWLGIVFFSLKRVETN